MTPESSYEDAAPPMSEVGRLTGVFLEPKKAFADIAAKPRWYVPVILMVIFALAFTVTFTNHIGWEHFMRQNMENNTRVQQMDKDQREDMIQKQVKFAPVFGYVASFVFVPVAVLVIGAVLLLMAKMGGGTLKFKQSLGIAAYGKLPDVLFSILAIVVMFLKNPEDFNLNNPLAFNLGAFLEPPPNTGKFVYGLAKSFDLFAIWEVLLMAVGISVATRRIPFSKAVVLVAVPWLIWILVSSGSAGLFG